MIDRKAQLDTAFRMVEQLLGHPAAQNDNARPDLARWHLEEAERYERQAAEVCGPLRQARHLNAARHHRDCAELALLEG